jgi:hypothetical protein
MLRSRRGTPSCGRQPRSGSRVPCPSPSRWMASVAEQRASSARGCFPEPALSSSPRAGVAGAHGNEAPIALTVTRRGCIGGDGASPADLGCPVSGGRSAMGRGLVACQSEGTTPCQQQGANSRTCRRRSARSTRQTALPRQSGQRGPLSFLVAARRLGWRRLPQADPDWTTTTSSSGGRVSLRPQRSASSYGTYTVRTTLELDDALVAALMARPPGVSKTEAIQRAVRFYLTHDAVDQLRQLAGTVEIEDLSGRLRARDRTT